MTKTLHVLPTNGRWEIRREGARPSRLFSTQKEAIHSARTTIRSEGSGQIVVY